MTRRENGRRVLIVDDEQDIRDMYRLNFEIEGWTVSEWSSGSDLVEQVKESRPDWLVLDLRMPGVDGWDALRALRSDARTIDLPITVVTGESDIERRLAGWEPGLLEFLQKPFSPTQLVEIGARAGTAADVAEARAVELLGSLADAGR